MDFTPETDFQTWYMLLTLTIDEGGEIQCLQDDFIRILKYYIDNKTLPPEISDFNRQFIGNYVPEIISHITAHTYAELNDDYSTYFNILINIAKLLVEGLSKDIFESTIGLSYLFNYEDNFFLSIQNSSPQLYKNFCSEFLLNGYLEPLINRLHEPSPQIQHFFHFFRIVSLTRISSTSEDIQAYIIKLKNSLINFIDNIDINSSRNIDSNKLLFICTFSFSAATGIQEFDDISVSCTKFALKCITCEFLDKQICGAKLLNKIIETTISDNRDLLIKTIKDLDIYNIIVSKNYHESVLPHLCAAFDLMTQIEIDSETFIDILKKIWNKIQHSHFTEKDQWIDMLFDGVNNCYSDLKLANSFLIEFLLKIEQNETTIEVIEKFIIHLPIEFLSFSTKLLEFLLSMLSADSSNQKNELLSEIALTSVKRIAISVNIGSLQNIILNYCRKELLTAVSTKVIEILQFLIEGSSVSSPGVGVSQIVNDSLIDTLICALNSNKSDKEPIYDLLSSCYSKVSSTPIKMNSKHLSQILGSADDHCWGFLKMLFDQRSIEFLEDDSIQYLRSYLSEKVDYSKSDQIFVMFLYNFVIAFGIAQNKVVRKIQAKNQIRYTITDTNLEGIEFLTRILYESKDEQTLNQLIDVFLYLISVCRNLDNRGKMIEYLLSFILKTDNNDDLFDSPVFSLFVKIINKFEEGVGIEEFGIDRHSPFDTSSNINITINNTMLKLNVNPYILTYSLCQKVAFHLKSTENSVFLYYDNIRLLSNYQLITYDIKDGDNLRLDKILLEPCNYSIENVPTFIFCKHKINNLCLSLLRKNCDSRIKKKQIWKLLKLLPSLKFENKDELITRIKDAVDEYELFYLLQIALKEKIECSTIILDLLKEQNENENEKSKAHSIIRGKPISPALTILSLSSILVLDYSNILLDIIKDNIVKTKAIDSSIFMLTKICTESNDVVSKFLLGLDYTLLSSDVLLRLIPIFKIIEDKSTLFSYLSKYITGIQNTKFCMAFFTLLSVLVIEETTENKDDEICNKYDDTLNLCFKLLEVHKNESLILYGVCIFISVLFEKVEKLIPKHSNKTATILVPYLLTVTDEKTQQKISSILIKVLDQEDTKQLISTMMKDHFLYIPDRWNYNPSKNQKLISQLTGLKNLGATCFMNSILQQLYSNSIFRSEFSKYKFDTTDPSQPNNKYLVELQKLFIRMQLTSLPYLDTKNFCKLFIFQDKRPINVREQQDAIEFFQFIVDKFPKSLHQIYEGQIVNTIKGIDVEFESNNYESFYNICLPVKGYDNFDDSFESFLKEEIFSGDNQYYAEYIDAKIDARKYSRISKLPSHLVIQLKRFEYNLDTFMKYKVNDRFTFPLEFNAAKYTTNPDEEQLYKLTGIVIHDGVAEAGHYYSIVLIDEEWYCFDDNDVFRYNPRFFSLYAYGQNNSNTPSAYLLYYTRKDSITKYFIENVINESNENVTNKSNNNDDSKLDLFCPSSLKDEIDKENHTYNQMQSIFTYTIMQFMKLINDPEVVILYVLNVFMHSQYSSRVAPSFSIYSQGKSYDSNLIISIAANHSQSLIDVLLYCSAIDQVSLFMKFLQYHICNYKFSDDDNSICKLAKDSLDALEYSISVYRSIPLISSIIFYFLEKEEGKKYGLENNFSVKILDFLANIIESNRANVFWSNLDLHYLFDSLVILKEGFELKSLVNLMNNCNNFLLSKSHSKSFIKLFMNCYEYDLFISHTFRLFTTQTIGKVIIETFCCCDDEESVKKMMALFLNQSEIYRSDISYNIYFAIEEKSILSNVSSSSSVSLLSKNSSNSLNNTSCDLDDDDDIINIIMKYKQLFLFDFLICDEEISRSYTEEIIYSLFPSFSQPKTSSNPLYDFLITTSSELLMRLKEMEIDPIKAPLMNGSEAKFTEFVECFVNYFNQLINNGDNSIIIKNRLTSASRIIRWMISNIVYNNFENSEVKKNLLKKLYDLNRLLLDKVVNVKTAYDGNVYELLLNSLMILTPDFADRFDDINIDIRNIILNLFPTNSFNRYTLYISDLFLVTFIIFILNLVNLTKENQNQDENNEQNELLQFFDNEVFKATFIEFIRKSPSDVMDIFCRYLIEQFNTSNNEAVFIIYNKISHSILSIIEPNIHQMVIDNVFSVVKVVFSLNIHLPSELFEDIFSFLIVFVEMSIEKRTNESINEIIFLIEACIPHLKNQKSITNGIIDKYVPMFLDLYCSQQLSSPRLRFILREFFGLLCQKDELLKDILIAMIYQFSPLTCESISFFLRVISEISDDEAVFNNLLRYLLMNIISCLRNLTEDCEEAFEELNIMIKSHKINFDSDKKVAEEEKDVVDSCTLWTYFVGIAKFLLTVIEWKENTSDFFIFVLTKISDSELLDLLKILKSLIHDYIIEEGIAKAAFIVRHKPEQRQFILKVLEITPESPSTWPETCRKYISTFFP